VVVVLLFVEGEVDEHGDDFRVVPGQLLDADVVGHGGHCACAGDPAQPARQAPAGTDCLGAALCGLPGGTRAGCGAHALAPRPVTSEHGDGDVAGGGDGPATCRQLEPFQVQVSAPADPRLPITAAAALLMLTPPKSTIEPPGPSAIDAPVRPSGCGAAAWRTQRASAADQEYSCPDTVSRMAWPPTDATVAPASESPAATLAALVDWLHAEPTQVYTEIVGRAVWHVSGWLQYGTLDVSVTSVAWALAASPKATPVLLPGMIAPLRCVHCPWAHVQVEMVLEKGGQPVITALSRHGIDVHTDGLHGVLPLEPFCAAPVTGQTRSGMTAAPDRSGGPQYEMALLLTAITCPLLES
jgi:hypothetical protein